MVVVQLLSHIWLCVTPQTATRQASLSTISWSLLKFMSIESVMPSNHLILSHPLILLPSIFPSIKGFSNESALCINTLWPKYWSHPKKGNANECSNYSTIVLISHASKVMLKILQARLQQYVNWELPGVQAGFRKGRRTTDQLANIQWIIEKAKELKKNLLHWLW